MTTAREVAEWMAAEATRQGGYLTQADAVTGIERRFGRAFVAENAAGADVVPRAVLAAFRALTKATLVWEQSELAWRKRLPTDGPARRAE